jgi:hypothetical protein
MFRWISQLFSKASTPRKSSPQSQRQSLMCEALETRFVPATLPGGRIYLPLLNTEDAAIQALGLSLNAPQITFNQQSGLAAASSPTITGTVTPGSALQASVDGGAFVSVSVDAAGQFSFTPPQAAEGSHTVSFLATGTNFLTSTATFQFVIDTVAPVIAANQTFNINENLPNNNTVGTLTASDARPVQNWTITAGNTNGAFAINATTGQITVNNSIALDRETTAAFTLQVTVSDGVNTSAAQNVTITLNDVNDVAPVVDANLTFTLAENTANGTVVGTAAATDGDVTNTTFSNWTLTGGNGAFAINATTGQITVANSSFLDREARANITFQLRVSDGINVSGSQNVTIHLTDVNDVAPVIAANQTFNLATNAANGTVFGPANATDGDVTPTVFQNWTITGGNPGGAFAINQTTGQITLVNNASFTSNTTLQLTVSDGVNTSAVRNVTITRGVNTNPPVITANQTFTLPENTANGTVVGSVAATDADGPTTFQDWAIFGGNASGAFAINATTGQITVANASLLDRETRGSFRLEIIVSDGAIPSSPTNITINLTDVNDAAPVIPANQTFTLDENSANGTVVGTANATDGDVTPTVFQNWTITGGNANGAFAINATTGQITVANGTALDREALANFTLSVSVSDGVNTGAGNITIQLNDVNDVAPVVAANQTFTLPEDSINGTVVGSLSASDGDVSPTSFQNWTITGGNANGAFALNATTGQLSVANSAALGGNFTLAVTVSDGLNISSAQNITIHLTPNANAPVITANQTFALDENSGNGTNVGVVLATDADGPTIFQNWTIAGGNLNNAFAINPTTGQISVANSTVLDREALANITLQLTVSDGLNVSNAQNVTITLNDVNDVAPLIDANQSFAVFENNLNGTVVGTVAASDGDVTPTTFQNWTITSGNVNNAFAIDPQTGQISVANATALDREAVAAFSLQFTVSDGVQASVPQTVTIVVNDVNDVVPVIDANQTFTLPENTANGTAVGTASATDGDVTPTTFQNWTIVGGNVNDAFAIDADTGEITVANASALDREAVSGFTLSLTVSDGVHTASAGNITIHLTDVNDVVPVVSANQTFLLPGNSPNGAVVGTANATDGDVTPTTFQNWTIAGGNTDDAFAIDADTGQISVANASALSGNFTLQLTVSDGVNTSAVENLTITVVANASAPVITANQSFALDENSANGTTVGVIDATDADANTSFQAWTITAGNDHGAFAINATTGEITVADASALDRETTAGFTLSVTVSDGLFTSAAANVTIQLNDVNDVAPVIPANQTFTLPENSANGTVVGFANATDGDVSPTSFQNWTIIAGNDNGAFAINATTGEIVVVNDTALDREARAAFSLQLTVSDGVNTSSAGTVTVNLTDVNDVVPAVAANQTFTLPDSSANGTIVGTLAATDGDATPTIFQNWTITAGNDDGVFAIDPATGTITVADNTTLSGNFTLSVTVSDGLNTSPPQTITVVATPPNAPPVVSPASATLVYTEDDGPRALDANLTLSDADSAQLTSATISFSAGYSNLEDVLTFTNQLGITGSYDAANGTLELTGNASLDDYQTALRSITYTNSSNTPSVADRTITITVSDGTDSSTPVTRTITITAVNDAPVVTTATGSVNYIVGGSPVVIDPTIIVDDVDSPTLVAAVVFISQNFVANEDVLTFVDTANILGTYDSNTGILQLSGDDTIANYEAALRSITYSNNNGSASFTPRTVTIQVSDGEALNGVSLEVTRTIQLVPNDTSGPVITAALANDTGFSDTDNYTANASITGTISDASNITIFRAGFNGEPVIDYEDITGDVAAGTFTLDANRLFQINNNATLADGNHTLHFTATDAFGNTSNFSLSFTLDTTPPDVTLGLDPNFDSGTLDDNVTVYNNVTVRGTVEPNSFVTVTLTNNPLQPPTQAVNGTFSVSGINLTLGTHTFGVIAEDLAGNTNNTLTLNIERQAANLQIVSGTPDNATLASNGNVAVTVQYATDPANGTLSGLGLRLHFNSSALTFNALQSLLAAGSPVNSVEDDNGNFDGDADTDKFILVTWLDATEQWPGSPTQTLYIANFTGVLGFTGETTLRFTAETLANGYDELFGAPLTITFI